MKHSLDLFEQPIPVLRTPEPVDGVRIAALAEGLASGNARDIPEALVGRGAFRETSVLAELDGQLLGWISAYILPYDPQTLFIWTVEVVEADRDVGISALMLGYLMRQEACAGVTRVQTVISCDEDRPWELFRRFARWQHSRMNVQPYFTQALTPHKRHENENLVTICLPESTRSGVKTAMPTEASDLSTLGGMTSGVHYCKDAATLGDRIFAAREAIDLSQTDAARSLGVEIKTLQSWEDDSTKPRANKAQMVSGVLGVSLVWLLTGEGDGVSKPGTEGGMPTSLKDVLDEMRNLKSDILQSARKLSSLEKRLCAAA